MQYDHDQQLLNGTLAVVRWLRDREGQQAPLAELTRECSDQAVQYCIDRRRVIVTDDRVILGEAGRQFLRDFGTSAYYRAGCASCGGEHDVRKYEDQPFNDLITYSFTCPKTNTIADVLGSNLSPADPNDTNIVLYRR